MAGRKPSRRAHGTHRDYPRTARLNELLREILAEELERVDDERLTLLTIISVDVDADLRKAIVVATEQRLADRKAAYAKVARVVLSEGGIIYLYHRLVIIAHSTKLQGYKQMPDGLVRVVGLKLTP